MEDLDGLYAGLERVPDLGLRGARRIHGLLTDYREQAFLSRDLTRIRRDVRVAEALEAPDDKRIDANGLADLALPVQLRSRCQRLLEGTGALSA